MPPGGASAGSPAPTKTGAYGASCPVRAAASRSPVRSCSRGAERELFALARAVRPSLAAASDFARPRLGLARDASYCVRPGVLLAPWHCVGDAQYVEDPDRTEQQHAEYKDGVEEQRTSQRRPG